MFCDLNIRRKNNNIEVKDKMGKESNLYPKILSYVRDNNVLPGREYFFKELVSQDKLKSYNPEELALGLYSIAWHSGKTEGYWSDKIDQLLPQVKQELKNNDIQTAFVPALKLYENFLLENDYSGNEILPILSESEYYSELTKSLLEYNPGLKVAFVENTLDSSIERLIENDAKLDSLQNLYNSIPFGSSGIALLGLNSTLIWESAAAKTIVHEIVHLTIQKQYDSDKNFKAEINKLFDIAEKYITSNGLETPYGLTNEHEFLAEALSNPEFMKLLNEIPSGNTSVWSEFMTLVSNFINQIFNVGVNPNSVLAELSNSVEQAIQNNKTELAIQEDMKSMLENNFDEYFPQYEWLGEDEKQIVIDLVDQGKIELSCKI